MIRQVWLDTDSTERVSDGSNYWTVVIRISGAGQVSASSMFTSVATAAPDRLGALLAAQKKMERWVKGWNMEEATLVESQRTKYIALPLFHGVSHAD